MIAPLPPNESERLATLHEYAVLDTPPEQAFERLTALAAQIFQAPISLVSLVDKRRQWFKSCFGFDMREMSRDIAFCAHALLGEDVLVVRDATQDPRFRDNPLVTGDLHVRFYAGAPLRSPDGYNLGTLCILDTKPRDFSPEQEHMLSDLAAIVVDELELRVASRQLREEVRERRIAEQRLKEIVTHDPLTGLYNRLGLRDRLEEAIANAHGEKPAALLYLDLDSFKIVNDTVGHGAGDQLLVQIAKLLRRSTREHDVIARFGGDEFVIVLNGASLDAACGIADRIRSDIERYSFSEAGKAFKVGVSIGMTMIDEHSTDEQLLANADSACYAAKARGRNRVELYERNREEIEQLRAETDMAGQIREALREGRMELWLQPVVNLATGDPEHFEALLRMRRSTGEIVLPAAFMPAAGRFNLVGDIDRWVIRSAAAMLKASRKLSLFLNLSAKSLGDPHLIEYVQETCRELDAPAERLVFELTEAELIQNLPLAQELIGRMSDCGFRFGIDDFGAGVSQLTHLKTLKLDFLKIDGSLIREIGADPTYAAFVKAINDIAHTLGVCTVAECVETRELAARLREIGVDYGQGYYFGPPEAPEAGEYR